MSVCLEAHEILMAREAIYGPMASSWEEVALLAGLLTAPSDSPGQRAVLVLIAAKLVRRKHSPENADHARDACGYLGILTTMEREHGGAGQPPEPAPACDPQPRVEPTPPPSSPLSALVARQLRAAIGGAELGGPT